ncbi:polyketide cyclase/dehydrase/lipid transport protein [Pseudonocardia sediminis]|uniref:Polyketide cyclase/dehydrase/lipid transport protein n=1 Tax=Pseudonocardia sediminis TaxID=1397368 RepID=A0A4Q7UUT8_PSEST|nr:SRPBCC family protein [Pseudonocardia sediminis]RZT84591.1 polyketide cyclase/dehydrase/lipid transport protein [Pseudonocardia sediminis]
MGQFGASAETVFTQSPEEIYDFVSDPHNWPKTFKGSAGMASGMTLPLSIGDSWTEQIRVGDFECRSTWTLITAVRPSKFVFQQVNGIAEQPDGTGGLDGITTISYTLTPQPGGGTLFHRSLHCEVPRGTRIPEPLLIARCQAANIEGYHDAVARELEKAAAEG